MTCGEKIAAERKKRNMTQDDLAEVLGVTRQAVSRWESNAAYPETEKLVRLAELFDLDLNYLLKDGAEPKPESCGGFVSSASCWSAACVSFRVVKLKTVTVWVS